MLVPHVKATLGQPQRNMYYVCNARSLTLYKLLAVYNTYVVFYGSISAARLRHRGAVEGGDEFVKDRARGQAQAKGRRLPRQVDILRSAVRGC